MMHAMRPPKDPFVSGPSNCYVMIFSSILQFPVFWVLFFLSLHVSFRPGDIYQTSIFKMPIRHSNRVSFLMVFPIDQGWRGHRSRPCQVPRAVRALKCIQMSAHLHRNWTLPERPVDGVRLVTITNGEIFLLPPQVEIRGFSVEKQMMRRRSSNLRD